MLVRSGALLPKYEPGLCRRALFWQNEPEVSRHVAPRRKPFWPNEPEGAMPEFRPNEPEERDILHESPVKAEAAK